MVVVSSTPRNAGTAGRMAWEAPGTGYQDADRCAPGTVVPAAYANTGTLGGVVR